MRLREHAASDDKKVWLSDDEVQSLIDHTDDTEKRIAYSLGAYCGLRSFEWLDVRASHVVDTDAGTMLRVPHGKGDKYRETPCPTELATMIRTVGEYNEGTIISVTSTRSLRRWMERTRQELYEETGEEGWLDLTTHDLRRTWATQLSESDVDPLVVLDWGGWNDLETFLDHYRGTYSPKAQRRERGKVDWL